MAKVDTSLVAHLPLFSGVKPDDLEEILREARSARYPRNTAIFEQGADAQSFFLLLHGHVRAAKTTPTGEQIVVRYVAPGETFGLAMAIGAAHYPATAMAVDDSVVLIWPNSAWPRLIERFPAIAANTLQTVGARLQESQPASSKCRPSRSSSASRMRCCGSQNSPARSSTTASRSTSRSAARTSRR